MKKYILLIGVFAVIGGVTAMDKPEQQQKLSWSRMDEQWEKDKNSVEQWKRQRKNEDEAIAKSKAELKRLRGCKEKIAPSSSWRAFSRYWFYNKDYSDSMAIIESKEKEELRSMHAILAKRVEEDYEHEKKLFNDHLVFVTDAVTHNDNTTTKKNFTRQRTLVLGGRWFLLRQRNIFNRSHIKKSDFALMQEYKNNLAKE